MRFQSAALLAALAIVSACAKRLKIPNERPDINSTLEGDIISGGSEVAARAGLVATSSLPPDDCFAEGAAFL
jgi:hypothetical protein